MRPTLLLLACVAGLCACSMDPSAFATKHSTPPERAFARHYLDLASRPDLDSAFALLAPELRTGAGFAGLRQASTLLQDTRLDSLHIIGFNYVDYIPAGHRELGLNYEGPTTTGRWVTIYVATRSQGDRVEVTRLSLTPLDLPLERQNAFTLAGKGPRYYVWLLLSVAVPVFCIAVAVVTARTKGMRRRWLWTIAALIASPVFTLNWATGAVAIRNSLFILLGAGFTKAGPAAPWLFSVASPIGALAALLRRHAAIRRQHHQQPSAPVAA
jgi:hypothetical protein